MENCNAGEAAMMFSARREMNKALSSSVSNHTTP
jgi:hypothetical protein